jgi:hypothetical protein
MRGWSRDDGIFGTDPGRRAFVNELGIRDIFGGEVLAALSARRTAGAYILNEDIVTQTFEVPECAAFEATAQNDRAELWPIQCQSTSNAWQPQLAQSWLIDHAKSAVALSQTFQRECKRANYTRPVAPPVKPTKLSHV